jgi:hypothetical protein
MPIPKVSVIIPVYNSAAYLEACLRSVIAQDYGNIEIITINDGSTDGSQLIIEAVMTQHPKFLARVTENGGPSAARNLGIELATGDYLFFLDDDDWMEPHAISRCMAAIRQFDTDIVFFSATAFVDGATDEFRKRKSFDQADSLIGKAMPATTFFCESIALGCYYPMTWLFLQKRQRLAHIRFCDGVMHEDNMYTAQLLLDTPGLTVACISDRLYHRRFRPGSIMTMKKRPAHVLGLLTNVEALQRHDAHSVSADISHGLDRLAVGLTVQALNSCLSAYGNHFPWSVRKRVLHVLLGLGARSLTLKFAVTCLIPDWLILRALWRRPRAAGVATNPR